MQASFSIQKAFGSYISELRKKAGLQIEQLADKSGLSGNRLSAIERGRVNISLETMLILAMCLDTSPQALFSGIAGKIGSGPESTAGRGQHNFLPVQTSAKQLYIGNVEVRPFQDCRIFDYSKGAFVKIVAWASDVYEFGRKVARVLEPLGVFAVTIEDVMPLEQKLDRQECLEEWIEECLAEVERNSDAIVCGPFHTYEKVDI